MFSVIFVNFYVTLLYGLSLTRGKKARVKREVDTRKFALKALTQKTRIENGE
jgi:hypothetical protein